MNNITINQNNDYLKLIAIYEEDNKNTLITKKPFSTIISDRDNAVYLYLGKKSTWLKTYKGCLNKRKKVALYFKLQETLNVLFKKYKYNLNVDLTNFKSNLLTDSELVTLFIETMNNANYNFSYKTTIKAEDKPKTFKYNLNLDETNEVKISVEKAFIIAKAVNDTRTLQDMAPNKLNSEVMATKVVELLKPYNNLKVTVLNRQELEHLGAGLLLAVNAASAYEPQLVIVEYQGDNNPEAETIGLVGKGITFDSGGYNVKPAQYMLNMKFDMSGAAIMANTMAVLAQFKAKRNVVAALAITDNMIGSRGTIPDSVVTSMSGKTVEITNTDAEGRLVMADAITYLIKHKKADKIIDAATLTGAVLVAAGSKLTGVFSSCNCLFKKFAESADAVFEEVWRLPFHRSFTKEMQSSPIADLINASYKREGGASCAATFLREFCEDKKIIHLDVAGTATNKNRGTGVMIKTLSHFLSK